ncbi:beta-eliminating lyase-related protein [Herminiimonas sp. CN]|uniref:beta-eliminating lyase-related protein n=1 Tax=Herminiimonas sp. CN TaxID=1349818 RepID=UPI000473D6AC|nr:beta-eliminating lyase-related protein [Herminiimonas sp. CN]
MAPATIDLRSDTATQPCAAMRQAGIMASAGIHALEHNVPRLAEDHANALYLAQGLAQIPGLAVRMPQTNIVYVDVPPQCCLELAAALQENGIVASVSAHMRLVTHRDVTHPDVAQVIGVFARSLAAD